MLVLLQYVHVPITQNKFHECSYFSLGNTHQDWIGTCNVPPWSLCRDCLPCDCSMMSFSAITSETSEELDEKSPLRKSTQLPEIQLPFMLTIFWTWLESMKGLSCSFERCSSPTKSAGVSGSWRRRRVSSNHQIIKSKGDKILLVCSPPPIKVGSGISL